MENQQVKPQDQSIMDEAKKTLTRVSPRVMLMYSVMRKDVKHPHLVDSGLTMLSESCLFVQQSKDPYTVLAVLITLILMMDEVLYAQATYGNALFASRKKLQDQIANLDIEGLKASAESIIATAKGNG